MSKNKTRIKNYLLTRQYRATRHEVFERAAAAGILERDYIGKNERSGLKWRLADDWAVSLTGDENHDFELIAKCMKRSTLQFLSSDIEANSHSGYDDDNNLDESRYTNNADFEPVNEADDGFATALSRKSNATSQPGNVLSLIKKFAPPLKPDEVTTALLLAKTLDLEASVSGQLMSAMKKQNPIIGIQVPVYGFVRQLGLMLEDGLILPFYTSLSAIESEPALSGRYNDLLDARRRKSLACMSGRFARQINVGDDLRQSISKNMLSQIKPLIIADEDTSPLPARIEAVANVTIKGGAIDKELIAEALEICCKFPVAESLTLMKEHEFNPKHLGIDDMAIAIRPGRSLKRIMNALMMLEADNSLAVEDSDGHSGNSAAGRYLGGRGKAPQFARSQKYESFYDVIEPCSLVCEEAGSKSHKTHLFIENLSGYGEAQQWALDLKQDLDAWEKKEVDWSDLSTRLLLSGAPGTGKTTYASALCNSLRIPLVSTSVARWLEASHLGDVLAAISATFKYAREHSPCILFIDEIDNIGSRNGGNSGCNNHKNNDYWASLINRMLELLDGTAKTDGVIMLGATNRPEKVDKALLRSGRLEKHIVIPPPDTESLIEIIAHHLSSDLDTIVEAGKEFSMSLTQNQPDNALDAARLNSVSKVTGSVKDKTETGDLKIAMKGVTNDQT